MAGMDMEKLLQQMGQMQQQMAQAQAELANETVEASAGGGMVTVTANGAGEIKAIKIDPKAIDPDDPELLGDMILAAVNEALRSAQSLAESKLGGLAGGALGGLGLPGLEPSPASATTSMIRPSGSRTYADRPPSDCFGPDPPGAC